MGPQSPAGCGQPPSLSCCPLAGQLRIPLDSVSARCRSLLSGHIAGMAEPPRAPRHRAQPPARIQGTCCLQAARGSAKLGAVIGALAVGSSPSTSGSCTTVHSSGRARGLSRTAAPRAPRLHQIYEGPVGAWLGLVVQPLCWAAVPKGQEGRGLSPPGPTGVWGHHLLCTMAREEQDAGTRTTCRELSLLWERSASAQVLKTSHFTQKFWFLKSISYSSFYFFKEQSYC